MTSSVINLKTRIPDQYTDNYKTVQREIKKDLNKYTYHVYRFQDLIWIYRFKATLIIISAGFFSVNLTRWFYNVCGNTKDLE